MVARRLPRWTELGPLLRPRTALRDPVAGGSPQPPPSRTCVRLARRRAPRAVFDYTDGAAGAEVALRRSREAYARVEFRPQVLQDVSTVDTSTTILGSLSALPLVFAPTGFTRLMHTEGEPAVARVAARAGIPYALSTMGTTSIEALADCGAGGTAVVPAVPVARPGAASRDFVGRAQDAGYEALVLTVDTPVPGRGFATCATAYHPSVAVMHGPSARQRCTRRGGSTC